MPTEREKMLAGEPYDPLYCDYGLNIESSPVTFLTTYSRRGIRAG